MHIHRGGAAGLLQARWVASGSVTVEYQANYAITTFGGTDTHNFSASDLGDEDADRLIVVGVNSSVPNTNPITGITIGGVAADRATSASNLASVWTAAVPTGATGDIVVTLTTTSSDRGMRIGVWRVLGADLDNPIYDEAFLYDDATIPPIEGDISIDVPAGGAIIGVGNGRDGNTDNQSCVTTLTGVTENYDATIARQSVFRGATGVSTTDFGSADTLSINQTWSGSFDTLDFLAMAFIGLRPS
jgi:hypothetical protein